MHNLTFDTSRLTVRPLTDPAAHAPLAARLATPNVTRYLPPGLVATGRTEPAAWLSRLVAGGSVFVVRDQGGEIGALTLHEAAKGWMFGYLFAEDAWGQGYATELVRGLIPAARLAGCQRLMSGVVPDHAASVRVLVKAGFATAGTLPSGGDFYALDL